MTYEYSSHIITLPPPYLSRSTTLFSSMLSPVRVHTRNLPSANWTLKRDSPVKRTRFHLRLDQRWCPLAQFNLSLRWRTVNGTLTYGRCAFKSADHRRFRNVDTEKRVRVALIRRAAVIRHVQRRFLLEHVTMYRSSLAVVLRSLPERGRSVTVPVCWWRTLRHRMVRT